MCGRYRRTTAEEELARRTTLQYRPNAICRSVGISLLAKKSSLFGTVPKTWQWILDALRWGLIPYWTKDPKMAYRMINASVETVKTAPSYRRAFKKRRCVIPADSFYEWKKVVGVLRCRSLCQKEHREAWLTGAAGKETLVSFPAEQMKAWPISPRVNSPDNNDADIISAITI
jgi:putative SOS response-associated peptidase YedK